MSVHIVCGRAGGHPPISEKSRALWLREGGALRGKLMISNMLMHHVLVELCSMELAYRFRKNTAMGSNLQREVF